MTENEIRENMPIPKSAQEIEALEALAPLFERIPPDYMELAKELDINPQSATQMTLWNKFLNSNTELANILGVDAIALYTVYGVGASIITGSALVLILHGLHQTDKNIKIHP